MEENFNKVFISNVDDFLDILQEITIRVNEDRLKYPDKYKDLTRFEIYENCRNLSIKYYNSTKDKDIIDFDDSIEEFLNNEYNINKYTLTLAIIRRGYNYTLCKINLVAEVSTDVVNKYKSDYNIKDNDIECIKFLPSNMDQMDEDLVELRKELEKLQSTRFLVLYRIKSNNRCDFKILNINTVDINPNNRNQVKDKILKSGQLDPNEVDIISLIRDSSPEYIDIFENTVKQLNYIQEA